MERRKNAGSDLNPNLKDMAEEDEVLKGAAPQLFGDSFSKKAKERDDELKALRKLRQPPKETAGWRGKEPPFFQGHRSYAQATRGGETFRGHSHRYRPRPYPARGKQHSATQGNQN